MLSAKRYFQRWQVGRQSRGTPEHPEQKAGNYFFFKMQAPLAKSFRKGMQAVQAPRARGSAHAISALQAGICGTSKNLNEKRTFQSHGYGSPHRSSHVEIARPDLLKRVPAGACMPAFRRERRRGLRRSRAGPSGGWGGQKSPPRARKVLGGCAGKFLGLAGVSSTDECARPKCKVLYSFPEKRLCRPSPKRDSLRSSLAGPAEVESARFAVCAVFTGVARDFTWVR